ncbi:MAG: glutamate racemase [Firmicutes bacterium]|nr:glutamate racemase [Bacillota bacterium]
MKLDQPIGVFDSGVGGLTVAREIWRQMPRESLLYFGDTGRVPYGGRPPEEIIRFSRQIIPFLMDEGAKLVVVACNTSSALALPHIRGEFSVPIVGLIEPGAGAALVASRNGKIGMLATEGTVKSGAYQKAVEDGGMQAYAQACPALVPLIEAGQVGSPEIHAALEGYLEPLRSAGADTVLLACTHYPFLEREIRAIMGPGVKLVDPAERVVARAREILTAGGLLNTGARGEDRFYVSGDPGDFQKVGSRLLGTVLPGCSKAVLDESGRRFFVPAEGEMKWSKKL